MALRFYFVLLFCIHKYNSKNILFNMSKVKVGISCHFQKLKAVSHTCNYCVKISHWKTSNTEFM